MMVDVAHHSSSRHDQHARCALLPTYMSDPSADTDGTIAQQLPKKRRRRRVDSIVVPIDKNNEDLMSDDDIGDTDTGAPSLIGVPTEAGEPSKSKKCPIFSMTFPRYRIDLSGSKSKTNNESEQRRARRVQRGVITKLLVKSNTKNTKADDTERGGFLSGMFKGVLNSNGSGGGPNIITKTLGNDQRFRKMYSQEVQLGRFRWISSSSIENIEVKPFLDEDFHAAAAFWRMASDIASSEAPGEQSTTSWYLALPETTETVAQNLCDILNWYADLLQKEGATGDVNIRATIDLEHDTRATPVVQFTVTRNSNIPGDREQLQRQKLLPLLSNAEDTERQTKAWVRRLLVQMGICPFTKSEVKSGQGLSDLGVPVANIMYRHSDALSCVGNDMYLLMAGKFFVSLRVAFLSVC